MALKIYLGGPDVFLPDARRIGARKKALCQELGFEGLFPLDPEPEIGGDAAQIFAGNCLLLRQADIGMFNLTPFRGANADPGTVFELGFLFALGKPAYGYSGNTAIYRDRLADAHGPLVARNGRLQDRNGCLVEDFGLSDNLMIVRAIAEAGGAIIVAASEPADDAPLAAFPAFRACLRAIRDGIRCRAVGKAASHPQPG